MAKFEITGPDGKKYAVEGPEGATEQDALAQVQKSVGYHAPEPSTADTMADVGMSALRGINKGVASLATFPFRVAHETGDRLRAQGVKPLFGLPDTQFPDALIKGGYLEPPTPATTAGKYAESAGEALGSSILPSAGLVGNAAKLAKLAPTTIPRALGQSIGETVASAPGAAVAADAAAAVGSGLGQEGAKEAGFGPAGQVLSGLAAGVAPLAAASGVGGAYRSLQSARASANPYERVAKGLGDTSIDDLANAAAVGNTTANLGTSRQAIDVLGEEMVKANGNRRAAIPATLARLQANGVAPTTAKDQLRRIMGAHEDNELMLGEYPAVAQSDLDTRLARNLSKVTDEQAGAIEDTGTQRLIDYVANTGSMASSQNVRNAIGARAQGLKDSTEDVIRSLAPGSKTIQDVEADLNAATQLARKEYDTVYNSPGGTLVDNAKLHQGLQDTIDKYEGIAKGRSGEQAQAMNSALQEFFIDLPNGQKVIMPTLQMAQDMRGALRGIIQRNRQAGNDHIVNSLQPLYQDVTKVMQAASPAWAKANQRWADLNLDEVARDLGESFAKSAGPKAREQLAQFKSLAPEAQDIVRVHYVQQKLDAIENAAKLGGTKNLGELFTKAHSRAMDRAILGDAEAVQMARLIRDANVMARSRDMLKGSPTQPRQQMQKEQDADLNMISAAQNFDWRDWKAAMFEKAVALMRERRNKVIGKVVTTPMRDTPAVAEHLERMRQARAAAERYAQPQLRQPGYGGQVGGVLRELTRE